MNFEMQLQRSAETESAIFLTEHLIAANYSFIDSEGMKG